tara:strand:- start:3710 stop:4060 length:351 start_codon:yes stop_codon:yes gene_type:complete
MAWYDTIVDIKNTAVDFLRNDTVQDIAGAANYFLGDGGGQSRPQTTIIKPPSLGEYKVSGTNLSRSTAGKPTFKDIGEAGFQNYAALQAYWKYYLNSVGRMNTGTTGGSRRTTRRT